MGYLEDQDLDKCYELIKQINVLVTEQDEQNIKTRALTKDKHTLEKQIRERNTKRERNKNTFNRTQHRFQQELTRLNANIRAIKTRITNQSKTILRLEEQQGNKPLDENSSQKLALKSFETNLESKEKERTEKQKQIEESKKAEEDRIKKENDEFNPLDNTAKLKIAEFDTELHALAEITEQRRKKISHLSNEYYLLMPREEFQRTHITAINNRSMVNKYLRIMMSLSEHQIAISALMGAQYKYLAKDLTKIHPIDYCYISLKCKMLPIDKEHYEFKLILSYINRTASPKITKKGLKIFEIWKENEEKRFSKYLDYDNRMLLWHGSDTSNIAGILTKGLKIAPPEADATGYMFGKGVYFADAFQKSKNYASTGNRRNSGNIRCLFLCQVALGKMYEAIHAEYMEECKTGFHSTKGLGRRGPNPSNIKITFDGEIIPDSEPINYKERTTRDEDNNIVNMPFYLNWNEYIVYNEEQAKLKYLIMLE